MYSLPIESIEDEVVIIKRYATERIKETRQQQSLTIDEISAVMMYSNEWPHDEHDENPSLYWQLNAKLRQVDRSGLAPYFNYLVLLLSALSKLPQYHGVVYRGVKKSLREIYNAKKESKTTITWNGFSSTTMKLDVLHKDQFLGEQGERTLFVISCARAYNIELYSLYKEEEVLLPPLSCFMVDSILCQGQDLTIVSLKEVDPFEDLFSLFKNHIPIKQNPTKEPQNIQPINTVERNDLASYSSEKSNPSVTVSPIKEEPYKAPGVSNTTSDVMQPAPREAPPEPKKPIFQTADTRESKEKLVTCTLFPIYDVMLGKTTTEQMKAYGATEKKDYFILKDINFWHNGKEVVGHMYIARGIYIIPPQWENMGITWERSFNSFIELFNKLFGNCTISESPRKKPFKNQDCFSAKLETKSKEQGLEIVLTLSFDYTVGDVNTKSTLYCLNVRSQANSSTPLKRDQPVETRMSLKKSKKEKRKKECNTM